MFINYTRNFTFVLSFILSFSIVNLSQTAPQKDFPNIRIKNFGQMDSHYYRGAQPDKDDYKDLSALGINTVIDLRNDPRKYEKEMVETLGMKYFNIPMSDSSYPKLETIETFLRLINDPANGKIFVHCKGGKHRTGVTGAVYRMTKDGWNYDKVYQEMKNYRFYTFWGHGKMKDFVIDYANKLNVGPGSKTE